MPTALERLVKTADARDVTAALFVIAQRRFATEFAKAAADAGLADRMEKTAILGAALKGGLGVGKAMLGKTGPNGWRPSIGRAMTSLGAGGAAAGAVATGDDNAQYTQGRQLSNPLTWGRGIINDGPSHQQAFDANKTKLDAGIASMKNRMADAAAAGDTARLQKLTGQLSTGQFNNEPWYNPRLGGLNPFAERNMNHYAGGARAVQAGDPARIEQARAVLKDHAASLTPEVKAHLEKTIAESEGRAKTNLPWGPPAPVQEAAKQPGAQPGNYVYAQQRPQPLTPVQMRALNANDFRNNSAWEANAQAQTQPRG